MTLMARRRKPSYSKGFICVQTLSDLMQIARFEGQPEREFVDAIEAVRADELSIRLDADQVSWALDANREAGRLANLGLFHLSFPLARRSAAVLSKLLGPLAALTIECGGNLTFLKIHLGKLAEAEADVLNLLRELEKADPNHPEITNTLPSLADIFHHMGRNDDALQIIDRVINLLEADPDPNPWHQTRLRSSLRKRAYILIDLQRPEEARPVVERIIESVKRDPVADSEQSMALYGLQHQLAAVLSSMSRHEDALAVMERSTLAIENDVDFGLEHPFTIASQHLLAILIRPVST